MSDDEELPKEAEKIRYRIIKEDWAAEDVPFDSFGPFIRGWGQHHNSKRGKVIKAQYKFNNHPEK